MTGDERDAFLRCVYGRMHSVETIAMWNAQ